MVLNTGTVIAIVNIAQSKPLYRVAFEVLGVLRTDLLCFDSSSQRLGSGMNMHEFQEIGEFVVKLTNDDDDDDDDDDNNNNNNNNNNKFNKCKH